MLDIVRILDLFYFWRFNSFMSSIVRAYSNLHSESQCRLTDTRSAIVLAVLVVRMEYRRVHLNILINKPWLLSESFIPCQISRVLPPRNVLYEWVVRRASQDHQIIQINQVLRVPGIEVAPSGNLNESKEEVQI
ncbi:unnamed protein product [Spodoptera exigua]|nr:unnamed protein product [Spodoptera exigua]